jgi:type III restriction enzyme
MPRPRKSSTNKAQLDMLDVRRTISTAPCVRGIEQEVKQWRADNYPGITDTTRRLLSWWFKNDHRTPQGKNFKYYNAQQEAIETLIYVFEVKKIRRSRALILEYFKEQRQIALPTYDEFPRYAIKMATGSGKTKVMSLAIAWQYFNAVHGEGDEYATTFLLLSPNIIVQERLALDFAGGRIFKNDPVIPPEMQVLWDFDVYLRGDGERTGSAGALYVTNIQQLYEDGEKETAPNPVAALLGSPPPANLQAVENFLDRISRRGSCMVINDEAHHTNDEAVGWNNVIKRVHENLAGRDSGSRGLSLDLDFSATPRQRDGSLFTWTIYDYPLKQAIVDAIVKRPLKGIPQGIEEIQSSRASKRFEPYIVAAVERWQEYRDLLESLDKKPILFFMLDDTANADDVAEYLRTKYPACFDGDKLLVIHTKKTGEIVQADLEKARVAARRVDEENSPINAIVSVLMLREGWDVNNVTVVAGLRAFSAKANILPEQAVGRGLRLMFREHGGYREHVDIIGNSNFMQVVEDLEKAEGIKLETFDYGRKRTPLVIPTIQVVPERVAEYDIAIPVLTPRIERKKEIRQIIEELPVEKYHLPVSLSLDENTAPPTRFTYEGRDVISEEVVISREYQMPEAQTSAEVIAYFSQEIASNLKLPAQFAALAPKVEQFLRRKAFGRDVELDHPAVLRALNQSCVYMCTARFFLAVLRPKIIDKSEPVLDTRARLLSATPPFPWSGKPADVKRTIFSLTPCGNEFEVSFAHFLNVANDVAAFANLGNLPTKLTIEYLDGEANLRHYEPDFVARDAGGSHWLLETKGREDPDVIHKDKRAEQWCEDVTTLTGVRWRYLKVPEREFKKLNPRLLTDLVSGLTAGGLIFAEL